MTEYDYFIAGFSAETDSDILRQLIVAQPSLVSTFSYMDINADTIEGVSGCDIGVHFTGALGGTAQTLLAGLMATYMTSVPVAKIKKLSALKTCIQSYIDLHYDLLTRQQFLSIYTLAKFDSLTNRAAYIRPALDWMNSILAYAAASVVAIQALTVKADVESYAIDIAGNVSSDPLLTVGAAILIVD